MNEFPNPDFHLPDVRFKTIISNSLPRSWRSFVEPYMGNAKNANDPDPKRRIQSDTFIGILCEEYKIQKNNEKRRTGLMALIAKAPTKPKGPSPILRTPRRIQELSDLTSADRQIPCLVRHLRDERPLDQQVLETPTK